MDLGLFKEMSVGFLFTVLTELVRYLESGIEVLFILFRRIVFKIRPVRHIDGLRKHRKQHFF